MPGADPSLSSKYEQPASALSLGLRCLIHAGARLTDSIPGESATAAAAAAALIESEGGEGAAAVRMKMKPQIAAAFAQTAFKAAAEVEGLGLKLRWYRK